ncbi:MAG: hypothetical protein GXP47_12860 [Acidobacteria bacterium]|nr:hypothetical protein [Acidobacteriota bacterium]
MSISRFFCSMVRSKILPLTVLVVVFGGCGIHAADIFEPWERGLSDVELFLGTAEGGHQQAQALAGFGFGRGGSLGLSVSTDEGSATRLGLLVAVTVAAGKRTDLSLWGESGLAGASLEVELAHADWTAGVQVVHWREGVVPYGVLSLAGEEGVKLRLHPLAGMMVPLGRVELHLELSSQEPLGGAWPVHLAVGPNVHLTPWMEVLPELSLVREAGGTTHWAATVGFIVDPRHWTRPER